MHAPLLALLLAATAVSPKGAIATAHPLASAAGAEALRAGGNAVDAAVAAAFALSVVQNESSGIGGGGFALVWLARERRLTVLDFREVAPAGATRDMFLVDGQPSPRRSREGGLAVAVPGAVKGYAELARRFGRLPLPRLVEPAARLAERGFAVGRYHAAAAAEALDALRADPAAAREFLAPVKGGPPAPHAPGDLLRRPDLSRTLRLLGRDPEAFYRGPLAARIAAAVASRGGILTAADLSAYRTREREPLRGRYRGHEIASMPPPSAGGAIVIGLLQALEADDPAAGGYRPEPFLHAFVEVEKRLFAERAGTLADPAFLPTADAAARRLVDPAFDRALRAAVGPRATPSADLAPAPAAEPGGAHTSHVSVVDAEGNAVALTTTVNTFFGAGVVVPGTGSLLNDQMDDFEQAPGVPNAFGLVGTGVNGVEPGKRPLSSMAPTLVFDGEGRVVLAVGSPGGSTIPSTVAQVLLHLLGDRMTLDEALGAPRVHHQWLPDAIQVEPFGLDAATAAALEARGHRIEVRRRPFGNPQAAAIDWATGLREAASEPRLEGAPAVP
ncbi:MAG TPA: gamma-glutamyltransferase [Anaeromyxobacteraceae bacterium]|nr:gamma-glutamyltransferase [Anaeromyxobacteraceae bacterium]